MLLRKKDTDYAQITYIYFSVIKLEQMTKAYIQDIFSSLNF